MVFMGVILQTTPGAHKSQEIRCRIMRRLDLWKIGNKNRPLLRYSVRELIPAIKGNQGQRGDCSHGLQLEGRHWKY